MIETRFNIVVVMEDGLTQFAISVRNQQKVLTLKARIKEILKVEFVYMDDLLEEWKYTKHRLYSYFQSKRYE